MRWPRVRFTLGTGLIGITATAILFGVVAYEMKPLVYKATIGLIANDGDADALARDLLSDAVLDSALTTPRPLGPGLAAMPGFRSAADPVAELRRCLQVERPARYPNMINLSTLSTSSSDASEIVSAVAAACQRSWGARRQFVGTAFTYSVPRTDDSQLLILMMAMQAMQWLFYVGHRIRKRRERDAAKVRPRHPAASNSSDTSSPVL